MDIKTILSLCDHTLLDRCATPEMLRETLDDAIKYGCATACIPSWFVKEAKEYVGDRLAICTVVGFPNGYSTTLAKLTEAKEAIASGADEIDTVINLGQMKAGRYDDILSELRALRECCRGKVLKVIVETCLLTEEEKVIACRLVTESGADYIKTSTGFSVAGATFEDVALFAKHVGEGVKIKAAGGISTLADAERFIELGASRLGTSRIVKIIKNEKGSGY
jgi:deoxyribose-phosphate aldolase